MSTPLPFDADPCPSTPVTATNQLVTLMTAMADGEDHAVFAFLERFGLEIGWLVQLVSEVRSVRSEMNVPAGAKIPLVLVGAGLMGLGMNLRETIGFYAPWLVLAPFVLGWKFQRKEILCVAASCALFVVLAFGWFGYWFITDPHYRWVWYGWR